MSEPAGSMPVTQSLKRDVGTIMLKPQAKGEKMDSCGSTGMTLQPLHNSQQRTQIVMSVSKVAWMRVR